MSMKQYLRVAPKAELHVHLEGSIQPATLLALAQRNGISLPVSTVEEAQQWFVYRDFNHFVEIFVTISRCFKTLDDYERVVYEFGENMAKQHILYAEVTFSPCTHYYRLGVPYDVYFTGLTRGRERVKRDFGLEINWVFDIVRNAANGPGISRRADYTTAVAIDGKDHGVVALGLGGSEVGYPPEWFKSWFEKAKASGLHSAPHAGETTGPASVWGALLTLGAERIGHGIRAIEDPALVLYLAEKQIPLEVSLTSNLRLGIYPGVAEHPLPQLSAAGVPLTVNSDDPSLFNTNLTQEVELLVNAFHFDIDAVNKILLNGIRYSFLPSKRKSEMEARFRAEMKDLQNQSL